MTTNKITAGANHTLHLGDNLATLKNYPDNTFDSIVTDPPYGIAFLGKDWDLHTGELDLYKECLRVLKPGGYMLAFSAARTYHQLASNIEMAGFEIRDQLMWLYSSGFPKAQDIGKAIQKRLGVEETKVNEWANSDTLVRGQRGGTHLGVSEDITPAVQPVCTSPLAKEWAGYKTALKPAHEPIVMARKPFKGSTIDNVLKNGLGAMNIDATRVPWADAADAEQIQNAFANDRVEELYGRDGSPSFQGTEKKKKSDQKVPKPMGASVMGGNFGFKEYVPEETSGRYPSNVIGEVEEGYQKYFYCPKVSRKERHAGFDNVDYSDVPKSIPQEGNNTFTESGGLAHDKARFIKNGNNHPTVKPVALMDYLLKLVTPPSTPTLQRKVLDPFMGSGSTGMAAVALGHHFTGCELDEKYVAIAHTRIEAWNAVEEPEITENNFTDLFDLP